EYPQQLREARQPDDSLRRTLVEKQSVYIETTVVSYLTAKPSRDLIVAAHQQVTAEWWERSLPPLEPFVSPIVIEEASRGDKVAAKQRLQKIEDFPVLEITDEVRALADMYFERIQIPEKARGDAYHLAVATYHGMDFLVSWNFTHILSARVKAVIYEINTIQGISTPIICTPEELMEV
ncbi:MAG: type II toxin-antitoxin system VapC family toxin, partial [Candidatus Bathyarchaeia archaeon]